LLNMTRPLLSVYVRSFDCFQIDARVKEGCDLAHDVFLAA